MRAMTALSSSISTRLTADLDARAEAYRAADPFPHIVLDDVLRPEAFAAAAAEFPGIERRVLEGLPARQRDEVLQHPARHLGPDACTRWPRSSARPEFVGFLEELTGIED